ncbi:unnamed protein product, partial [Symbiodinium microadriaticum]
SGTHSRATELSTDAPPNTAPKRPSAPPVPQPKRSEVTMETEWRDPKCNRHVAAAELHGDLEKAYQAIRNSSRCTLRAGPWESTIRMDMERLADPIGDDLRGMMQIAIKPLRHKYKHQEPNNAGPSATKATRLPHKTLLDLGPARRVPKKSSVDMQWAARMTSSGPKGYSTLPAASPDLPLIQRTNEELSEVKRLAGLRIKLVKQIRVRQQRGPLIPELAEDFIGPIQAHRASASKRPKTFEQQLMYGLDLVEWELQMQKQGEAETEVQEMEESGGRRVTHWQGRRAWEGGASE